MKNITDIALRIQISRRVDAEARRIAFGQDRDFRYFRTMLGHEFSKRRQKIGKRARKAKQLTETRK